MNISEPSTLKPAAEREAHRTAFRKAFWRNKLMDKYRQGRGNMFSVPILSAAEVRAAFTQLLGDGPLGEVTATEHLVYEFNPIEIGDELYLAVVCRGIVVVPPFPLPLGGRAEIPYFREEIETSRFEE